MATKPTSKQARQRTQLDVFLGKVEKPLGRLIFVKDGQRGQRNIPGRHAP